MESSSNLFSRVFAYSVASIIFFHITINIGMTIGLVPVIGIPLPLISSGGSSLFTFTLLIFILIRLALPANTVQVWPGGQTFNSIQAAINSISNAGPQLQYQVAVGAGTYNENVVMKDYVYVIGSGSTQTIITAAGQANAAAGVVNSASNCGLSELSLNALGGGWGTWPIGVKYSGSGSFHISGVIMNIGQGDQGGNNARGISNNTGSYSGKLVVSQSTILVNGSSQTTGEGAELFGMDGLVVFFNLCTIQVQTSQQSFGITGASGVSITIDDSKIIAATWALYNSDGSSPIVANQCTIDGPVSSGVVVNN